MGTINEFDGLTSPVDDTQDTDIEMDMNEDELLFDDFEIDEDEAEVAEAESVAGAIPGWRRIEIFRESRMLRSELADFEDYDCLEIGSGRGSTLYAP